MSITDGMRKKLIKHILSLSEAEVIEEAVKEWRTTGIELDRTDCPCGQRDIVQKCYIQNDRTGSETFIGNCCVKRFLGVDQEFAFKWLRRKETNKKPPIPDEQLIEYCWDKGIITHWEAGFLCDTQAIPIARRTPRQFAKTLEIIDKMAERMSDH